MRLKPCTICGETKPIDDFRKSYTRKTTGTIVYCPRCKLCDKTYTLNKYHALDKPSKNRRRAKNAEKFDKGWQKNYRLVSKYGITIEQFNEMYEQQHHRCYICHEEKTEEKIYVDHNHRSGQVRKLLCQHCNSMLGHAFENGKILERAIEYLREHDNTKER